MIFLSPISALALIPSTPIPCVSPPHEQSSDASFRNLSPLIPEKNFLGVVDVSKTSPGTSIMIHLPEGSLVPCERRRRRSLSVKVDFKEGKRDAMSAHLQLFSWRTGFIATISGAPLAASNSPMSRSVHMKPAWFRSKPTVAETVPRELMVIRTRQGRALSGMADSTSFFRYSRAAASVARCCWTIWNEKSSAASHEAGRHGMEDTDTACTDHWGWPQGWAHI